MCLLHIGAGRVSRSSFAAPPATRPAFCSPPSPSPTSACPPRDPGLVPSSAPNVSPRRSIDQTPRCGSTIAPAFLEGHCSAWPEAQSVTYPAPLAQSEQPPVAHDVAVSWTVWLPYLLLSLIVTALYYKVIGKLVMDWYTNPDFSHGFLVAPFAAFLLWDKRKVLRNTPIQQTWSGIWLVVVAIFFLFLGVYGAELFLSRLSLVMLLGGIVWTIFGRAVPSRSSLRHPRPAPGHPHSRSRL